MDGIIIVNKPKTCTSHDVVYKVKKIFNEKVGHTGTLDPMATGVLPLLIGKGTQCSKYMINHDKTYKVTLKLGIKTDTADSEGKIIEEKNVPKNILELENIENIFKQFLGKQKQLPPMYSAIKVNGKKLYEYARKGKKVEVKPRDIEIYEIKLIDVDIDKDIIHFKVKCSKGTYIRSLCEDISEKLGTIGYMAELDRIQVGEFSIEQAVNIQELEKYKDNNLQEIYNKFIKIEDIFEKNDIIVLDNRKLKMFLNGVKLTMELPNGVYKLYCDEQFIGTGIIEKEKLKRDVIVLE